MKRLARFLFFILAGLFLYTVPGNAQLNNSSFYYSMPLAPEDSGTLRIEVYNFAYSKNNEYFSKIQEGYTLFGYQANPKLVWFPSSKVRAEAGVWVGKDFGNPDYTFVLPTYTVKAEIGTGAMLNFGTLEGSLNHRLSEPLYDFERVIYDRPEEGLQLLYNKGRIWSDFWVDWESMIYRNSPFRESLWGGMSTWIDLSRDQWILKVPLQFTAFHTGGQIDTATEPVRTSYNTGLGLRVGRTITGESFLKNWYIQGDYLYCKENDAPRYTFTDGNGLLGNLFFALKPFDLMFTYWAGTNFFALKGGALYRSVSSAVKTPDYYEKERNLLFIRILKDVKLMDKLYLSNRFEPYYDFNSQLFELSWGLYLNYHPVATIIKPKK